MYWSTATEINNYGFQVERSVNGKDYVAAGFIKSRGNSVARNDYSFMEIPAAGAYSYRLKIIDMDGTYSFSKSVEVNLTGARSFALGQNYPNPFNPSTSISYSTAQDGMVNLSVYNMLGQKVAEIVNENKPAGSYNVLFDAAQLSTGTYIYKLTSNSNSEIRKMMLIK